MTLFTPSQIWEATDDELRALLKTVQNELILRNMDKPVTETIPQFADLEQEFGLRDTPLAEAYGG